MDHIMQGMAMRALGAIMKEARQFVGPNADPGSGYGFVPILVQVVWPEAVGYHDSGLLQ